MCTRDSSKNDDLNCLKKLEKLKVEGTYRHRPIQLQSCTFPQNLKEITFSKTLMPWEAMEVMSMLPNLEVLKLKNHACVGQEWELSVERGFPRLKVLIISVMGLKHWELADDGEYTFQVLERLVLRNCFELKEMPSWIENLRNLKSVQLEHCHASLVTSARMIQEERQLYGEEYGFEIVEFLTTQSECFPGTKKSPHPTGLSSVLELDSRLRIKGKLDTRRLPKFTSYSAYLIFKLEPVPYGDQLDRAFAYVRYIKNKRSYSENHRCQVFLTERMSSEDPGRFPNRRHDGWMEIRLGDFYISSTNEGEVEIRLWNITPHWKSGLIVRGIEVRPS
nr:putative late blight resistance protein homolog R1B-17 [Ipomoea batatas]